MKPIKNKSVMLEMAKVIRAMAEDLNRTLHCGEIEDHRGLIKGEKAPNKGKRRKKKVKKGKVRK